MSNKQIIFSKVDKGFRLETELLINKPIEEVFDFFSNAENLEYLTPKNLHFSILTPRPIEMKKGLLIDYKLKLYGLGFKWQTEISEWSPKSSFVDQQKKGPYTYWIHRHLFEPRGNSTLVKDEVNYAVFGGGLVDKLFIQRELRAIFSFRASQMLKHFA